MKKVKLSYVWLLLGNIPSPLNALSLAARDKLEKIPGTIKTTTDQCLKFQSYCVVLFGSGFVSATFGYIVRELLDDVIGVKFDWIKYKTNWTYSGQWLLASDYFNFVIT